MSGKRRALWAGAIALVGAMIVALFALVLLFGRAGDAPPTPAARSSPTAPGLAAAPGGFPLPTATPAESRVVAPTPTPSPTEAASASAPARPSAPTTPPSATAIATTSPVATASTAGTTDPPASGTEAAATASGEATASPAPSASPSPTPSPATAAGATASPTLAATATPRPGATPTPPPTDTPTATATPLPPGIGGRVRFDGLPVAPGLILVLEDQDFNPLAETTVGPGGEYTFAEPPPADAYHVTFAWERNQRYGTDEVIAWGWIGPVEYDGQAGVRLPDLEIGLQGLARLTPEPDTTVDADTIGADDPLTFAWDPHPAADRYWVDLLADDSFAQLWRSPLTTTTSTDFAGTLDDGARITPGSYWWAVGGRGTEDGYELTVYGHLAGLRLAP